MDDRATRTEPPILVKSLACRVVTTLNAKGYGNLREHSDKGCSSQTAPECESISHRIIFQGGVKSIRDASASIPAARCCTS
jgi:hypothetical protein